MWVHNRQKNEKTPIKLSQKQVLRVLVLAETLKGTVAIISNSTKPYSNKHATIPSNPAVGEALVAL